MTRSGGFGGCSEALDPTNEHDVPYEEKPAPRQGRIGWAVVAWILFFGPFTVLLFFWMGWWTLIPLVALTWMTYDYVRRGPVEHWEDVA